MRHAALLAIPALLLALSDPANAASKPDLIQSSTALAGGDLSDTHWSDSESTGSAPSHPGDDDVPTADDASAARGGEAAEAKSILPRELSADVALVSDYIFRGITNTDHNPALQGGLTYTADVGLTYVQPYLGFWGSNVRFDDGGEASVELDLRFGVCGSLTGVDWDVGALYYAYPGARAGLNYDYWEIPLQLSYAVDDQLSVFAQYWYSPNYFADSGRAHYVVAGSRWQQPIYATTLGIEASTGHQWIADNIAYGVEDYQDWRLALSLTLDKITLGVAYTDTNLGKSQCFSGTNQCEPRLTVSVGASL